LHHSRESYRTALPRHYPSNLDFSEWGDAFPDNRILGAATLDRLRHGAYRIVLEGESFRKPKPLPESNEFTVAKTGKKSHS
jgi:DNA replication protein DnaC